MTTPPRGLGRGLSALLGDAAISGATSGERVQLPIEAIVPNPDQPRRRYDQASLDELAESIRSKGVLQPLLVRPHPDGGGLHQLVAGERRWRAAQLARLHDVPVIIRELTDEQVVEIALIENVQRADLNAVEEAAGYRHLMERFGHTQEAVAEMVSKSRSHIANLLRLLSLPAPVLEMVRGGALSAGHARALITTTNPEKLARRVVEQGLSVRATEALAREDGAPKARNPKPKAEGDADTRALETDLSAQLRMRVSIRQEAGGGGQLVISYRDLDELDRLCAVLNRAG